jgi:SAM-dependent methyltransferase
MDRLLPYDPADDRQRSDPGIPRRLLRRLLRIGNISIGSRVLDAGCGRGELTRFLSELAIEASGIDQSEQDIAAAQAAAGQLDYACCRAAAGVPFPEQHFDAVLARELPEHKGNLLELTALRATAHLLATIRPEGRLIIVRRVDSACSNPSEGHHLGCYLRHLETFPGVPSVSYLIDSLLEASSWKRILDRRPLAGFVTAVLSVPRNTPTGREWQQIADRAALRRRQGCCDWGLQAADTRKRTPATA